MDAAENLFVPVAVYNTVGGADAKTVKEFKERAWDYSSVRIVDTDKKNLTKRLYRNYTVGAIANQMIKALEAAKVEIPTYLKLLDDECTARKSKKLEKATFAMG